MARPREFDEDAVLAAAIQCFWSRGYEATSMRDLMEQTGLTGASLYNAFGDKRALYRKALCQYVDQSVVDRIHRCRALPPIEAISAFFHEIVTRSLNDPEQKGCMLVNSALDIAPDDRELRGAVKMVLVEIENFFRQCVEAGQSDGTITTKQSAEDLGRLLLGVLMGLRVLARVRPDRDLFEGVLRPALAMLDPS
jgi:TetR/AcrR family transcriptional repressor of nem operon